jgi:hypothetical protein
MVNPEAEDVQRGLKKRDQDHGALASIPRFEMRIAHLDEAVQEFLVVLDVSLRKSNSMCAHVPALGDSIPSAVLR